MIYRRLQGLTLAQAGVSQDMFRWFDWDKYKGFARMDAKARYDSALRELGLPANQTPL